MTTDTKDISKVLTEIDQSDDYLEEEQGNIQDVYNSEQDDDRDVPDDDVDDPDDDEQFEKRWYSGE